MVVPQQQQQQQSHYNHPQQKEQKQPKQQQPQLLQQQTHSAQDGTMSNSSGSVVDFEQHHLELHMKMEFLDQELDIDDTIGGGAGVDSTSTDDLMVGMELDTQQILVQELQQQQQPQQQQPQQQQSSVVFGSQLVNADSVTPYSDATQVSRWWFWNIGLLDCVATF